MSLLDDIRRDQIQAGENAVIRNLERLSLATAAPQTDNGQMFVSAMANRVGRLLPPGWELRLCMENGSAWVTLHNPAGDCIETPDAADKSLEQQVDDALRVVIGGW